MDTCEGQGSKRMTSAQHFNGEYNLDRKPEHFGGRYTYLPQQ